MRHEVGVDTKLAEMYEEEQRLEYQIRTQISYCHNHADDEKKYRRVGRGHQAYWVMSDTEAEQTTRDKLAREEFMAYEVSSVERTLNKIDEARARIEELTVERQPLVADYEEHGWSRFFLVTSSAGHIHSTMSCSTCFPRTQYAWLPHLSGLTEKDAVEQVGPWLCSVCFPSAPTEWTQKRKLEKGARR